MTFLETFGAVFMATLIGQICLWIIERYIKVHMNKIADKLEDKIQRVIK